MKNTFSKKDAVEIIKRALTVKDREGEEPEEQFTRADLEKMAGEFGITGTDLNRAVVEIDQTRERNRDGLYPEVVTTRWISGRLTEMQIETFFSDLKLEFGGSYDWTGKPADVHKIGNTREYRLKNVRITLSDKGDGYQLRIIKEQFFHGNNLEAAVLSIPAAFIVGLFPVAAAAEWIHMLAAVGIGTVLYSAVFFLLKSFIRKKREETVNSLLRFSEYAEKRLKELVSSKKEQADEIMTGSNDHSNSSGESVKRLRT